MQNGQTLYTYDSRASVQHLLLIPAELLEKQQLVFCLFVCFAQKKKSIKSWVKLLWGACLRVLTLP